MRLRRDKEEHENKKKEHARALGEKAQLAEELKLTKDALELAKEELKLAKDALELTKEELKLAKDALELTKEELKLTKNEPSHAEKQVCA